MSGCSFDEWYRDTAQPSENYYVARKAWNAALERGVAPLNLAARIKLTERLAKGVNGMNLFLAMKFGNHSKALELLRQYLMNITGRILP